MNLKYKTIIVAVDGSEDADKAFNKSIEIAKRNEEATLILTHVVDTRTFASIAEYDKVILNEAEQRGNELLAVYEEKAKKEITNVETLLRRGVAKAVLTKEVVPEKNADLIIVGATGLNAVERFLIGSVSENIVRHATCDVLVVR